MSDDSVDPFTFFDRIVCINFSHRTDNYASAIATFTSMGIENEVEFVQPKLPDDNELYKPFANFEAHINVIRQSYINGNNDVLIFEDEIKPTREYSKQAMLNAVGFMSNVSYDIFHLGYNIFNKETFSSAFTAPFFSNNIIEFKPNSSFAYCISRRGMEVVLETYSIFIDKVSLNYMFSSILLPVNVYCSVPILFEQYNCYSNSNLIQNLNCYLGKLRYNYLLSWLIYTINKNDLSPIVNIVLILLFVYFVANTVI